MKSVSTIFFATLLIFFSCNSNQHEDTPKRPNIILIMSDDMGYSDIGCYGGEINTPHLDALAAQGLRFTQFYNTARCCPTRASLLTGLYPQQAGIGHMVSDRGTSAYQGDLSDQAVTIAEVLKSADYATYMSGKWHVTPYELENPKKHNWPRQRGFDRFFGMISGAGSLYDPRSLTEDNDYIAPREGFYCTTDFTNYALECISEHQSDSPYFLYLSYTAAHWPMHAPADAVAKYKRKYDEGWDEMRKQRYERMLEMGLIEPEWQMTERDSFVEPWSDDIEDRDWELANMEVYAAMVDLMDQGIGRVIEMLKSRGELENTLVFFLQDNGACAEELGSRESNPSDEIQPMEAGALQTNMIPLFTRDGRPVKVMREAWPGPPEGFTAYGKNWANASNTPFREYKHWVHEGGISTPLIVHWPEGIEAKGDFRTEPSHLIDIMATCVDVSGAQYPTTYQGKPITPLAGKSLLPVFSDDPLEREAIYWEHEGNRAVRMGKWKLVSKADKGKPFKWDKLDNLPAEQWELFDMDADRTETTDLASANPEIVGRMATMWLTWAEKTGAIPRPN
ncbi:MAG: arylsulfatase [Saprospiraceae bacterium]|nr:arylsulfatase [Saprospiraceae bacterium]